MVLRPAPFTPHGPARENSVVCQRIGSSWVMVILVSNRVGVWQLPGTNNGVATAGPKWNTTSASVPFAGARCERLARYMAVAYLV